MKRKNAMLIWGIIVIILNVMAVIIGGICLILSFNIYTLMLIIMNACVAIYMIYDVKKYYKDTYLPAKRLFGFKNRRDGELKTKIQIKILKETLNWLKENPYSSIGLCNIIPSTKIYKLYRRNIYDIQVSTYIPLFNKELAISEYGGKNNVYWWDRNDRLSRIIFIEGIINKLQNENTGRSK